jgi:glycosyltransferase involved in cell wall biosynthesis
MKILQLSTKVPYPPKDGGAAGVYVFSEILHKSGHSVTILAVNPPKHFIPKDLLSEVPATLQIDTVQINTNPIWNKALFNLAFQTIPYQIERFIDKKFEARLIELLLSKRPDIVQVEGLYLCPYIPVIKKHSDARIVLRSHNIEHILWQEISASEKNLLKRTYLKIQSQRIKTYEIEQFSKVDGITTVTENDRTLIKACCSNPHIKVIPFGLYPLETLANKEPNTNAIAFIGALDWIPNQEAILWFVNKVWPKIHQKFPVLTFHLAGRNAPSHFVTSVNQRKGVVFHGEVPDSKKFLSQFSIIIVPLFTGSGMRVKIIEAMQQGLAVISSAKAAEGIPAIPGKHLLLADSPDDFLSAITSILEDPTLLAKLSVSAMDFVREKFNILAIGSELINFYKEISNG